MDPSNISGTDTTSGWQKTLEQAWAHKRLIILSGNVRDLYLYENRGNAERQLLDLKDFLVMWVGRRVQRLMIYDPVEGFSDRSAMSTADTSEQNQVDGGADQGKVDRGADNAPYARDLVRISRALVADQDTAYIIQFTDKITTASPTSNQEKQIVLTMEKLIHDMKASNRLVLVYLNSDQIPKELTQDEPRAKVIEIPCPDRREIQRLFENIFDLPDDKVEQAVNACHGLTFSEIASLYKPLAESQDMAALNRSVRSYRFGERVNYWAELSLNKLKGTFDFFVQTEGIKGQDEAIMKVENVLVRARADIQRKTGGSPGRPRGVLFFAGPTGVGKTMTAQKLAKFLFGSESAYYRFDMSEYSQEHQVNRLYGSAPGYIGFEQGGTLTKAVQTNPFCVILFDEIEKAHPRVLDVFLQILSDGRLTDSSGETAFFSESIIIFTSNIGTRTQNYKGERSEEQSSLAKVRGDHDSVKSHFLAAVDGYFQHEISRPEIMNRIGRDNIVVFDFIDSPETAMAMFAHQLTGIMQEFNDAFQRSEPKLFLDLPVAPLAATLYEQHFEQIKIFGGRHVENVINDVVRDELAWLVLEAEERGHETAKITGELINGELRFTIHGN